jgi:DNA-binding NarL/FixJ family response regulator
MPELNGIDAGREIRKELPGTKIILLSMDYSERLVHELIAAGFDGYVGKSDSDRDLAKAIETVAGGKPFFTPLATNEMLASFKKKRFANSTNSEPIDSRLTVRELQVIQLLSLGKNMNEVGIALGISEKTADTHRSNLMRKLDLHNTAELVRYALRNRIIEP